MTFWLLQTMGDVDPDLVERAARSPRKAHPLRWVAAVAAAAVMVAGVGVWWHNRPKDNPPIINSDTPIGDTTTTTMDNVTPTQPTTTTTQPNGTGGDEKSCVVHNLYHSIPVSPSAVGKELYDAFWEQYGGLTDPDLTYPFTECNEPGNIVDFVKFTDITQEEFIADVWYPGYITSLGGVEAFLNTPFDNGNPYALFTYGDYFDAIYGDDPHLTAWVFHSRASSVPDDPDFPYQYCYRLRGYPKDPLYDLEGYYPYEMYSSLAGDSESIIGYVEFAGIPREKFIEVYGWEDKLDEKATDHFIYAPYTYRQFVDAIYGDDEALRDWVFDRYVFHPDYPKAP